MPALAPKNTVWKSTSESLTFSCKICFLEICITSGEVAQIVEKGFALFLLHANRFSMIVRNILAVNPRILSLILHRN